MNPHDERDAHVQRQRQRDPMSPDDFFRKQRNVAQLRSTLIALLDLIKLGKTRRYYVNMVHVHGPSVGFGKQLAGC